MLVFPCCSSSGEDDDDDDVLAPQHRRGAAGRREREGREQDRGSACVRPPFLAPVSLRFFDKNLKEEKAGIREERGGGARGRWQGADEARLTSLKMIHTGESVWMDSLMASSGPKDGSTSPSATPLEKEPGGESTGVTWGRSPGIQDPPPPKLRGDHEQPWQPPARNSLTQDGLKNQQCGHQYSAKCYT